QQTRSRWVKIVFTFDPAATWQWLTLPSERRKRLENQADAVVTPTRWTMTGIKQRLRHGDVIDTEDVCQSILLATGGWHVLVDQLFAAIKDQFEPRPIADTFRDQLMSGDG